MIKTLICLIWGHPSFNKIAETTVAPRNIGKFRSESGYMPDAIAKALTGYTTFTLHCPRCNKIKTITH